jgi:hypothetical protein
VPGRLLLVVVSPRTPPGLLSWPAWQALRSGPVLTGADSPQLPFLRDADVDVTVVDGLSADDLVDRAAAGSVVWLTTGGADATLVRSVGTRAVAAGVQLEQLLGSYDPPGARLLDVVAVMDRLRSPGGCPWDAEQTHTSLMPYLLEEAYEAYQALEDGDLADLREELGDVLLQVASTPGLRRRASSPGPIDDVAGDLVDKLVPPPPARLRRRQRRRPGGQLGGAQGRREGPDVGDRRRPARPAGPVAGGQAAATGHPGRGARAAGRRAGRRAVGAGRALPAGRPRPRGGAAARWPGPTGTGWQRRRRRRWPTDGSRRR